MIFTFIIKHLKIFINDILNHFFTPTPKSFFLADYLAIRKISLHYLLIKKLSGKANPTLAYNPIVFA